MTSLGEVATYIPISGSFTSYAARLVDPSLGFAMGWIYWFNWASTFAVELTATGMIIKYWDEDLSIAIFIAVFWVIHYSAEFPAGQFLWRIGILVLRNQGADRSGIHHIRDLH